MQAVTEKINDFRRKLVSGMMNPKFLFIIVIKTNMISHIFNLLFFSEVKQFPLAVLLVEVGNLGHIHPQV